MICCWCVADPPLEQSVKTKKIDLVAWVIVYTCENHIDAESYGHMILVWKMSIV